MKSWRITTTSTESETWHRCEVLQANPGKTVVVTYNMRDYTGEIVGLREPEAIGNPSATIRKTLRGAADLQSDDGETVKLGEAITTDNPMSWLTWEITLEAGKERTVTYRYKVWVRV